MSYCRFDEKSDVYVYKDAETGKYICCLCKIKKLKNFSCIAIESMINHLNKHIKNKDFVPQKAIDRLYEESKNKKNTKRI